MDPASAWLAGPAREALVYVDLRPSWEKVNSDRNPRTYDSSASRPYLYVRPLAAQEGVRLQPRLSEGAEDVVTRYLICGSGGSDK